MKFTTIFAATAALFTATQGYVLEMYPNTGCGGTPVRRNVYDNTCAYTDGFRSFRMRVHGGSFQQLTAYSRQACAGTTTFQGCAAGINAIGIGVCHDTDSGSNALSSYSSGGPCPN
jgi:hypothetical protein